MLQKQPLEQPNQGSLSLVSSRNHSTYYSPFNPGRQRDPKGSQKGGAARASESDQKPGLVSRIWLYLAVQKSFGAFRSHEEQRLCHTNTAAPFGPAQKPPGYRKYSHILPALSFVLSILLRLKHKGALGTAVSQPM